MFLGRFLLTCCGRVRTKGSTPTQFRRQDLHMLQAGTEPTSSATVRACCMTLLACDQTDPHPHPPAVGGALSAACAASCGSGASCSFSAACAGVLLPCDCAAVLLAAADGGFAGVRYEPLADSVDLRTPDVPSRRVVRDEERLSPSLVAEETAVRLLAVLGAGALRSREVTISSKKSSTDWASSP